MLSIKMRSRKILGVLVALLVFAAGPASAELIHTCPIIGDGFLQNHRDNSAWVKIKRNHPQYVRLENSGRTGRWYTLSYGHSSVYYQTYVDIYYTAKGNIDTRYFNHVRSLSVPSNSMNTFDFWNGEDVDFYFRVRTNYDQDEVTVKLSIDD